MLFPALQHVALGRARVTAGGAPSCHGGRHHRVHQAPTARPHDDAIPAPAPVRAPVRPAPRQRGGETRGIILRSSCWAVVLPLAVKAIWEKWECAVAPCQCFSSAGMWTTSPTVISCCVVSVAIIPVPSVTNRT